MTSEPATVMVHFRHVREAKLCARGAREWFARHRLPWTVFLADGLPASVFEATGDPLALRAVTVAREETAHGRR